MFLFNAFFVYHPLKKSFGKTFFSKRLSKPKIFAVNLLSIVCTNIITIFSYSLQQQQKIHTHISTHATFALIISGASSFIMGARASFVLFKYWLSSYSDVRVSKARVMDIKSLIKPVYTLHTQMRREGERAWPTNVPDSESGPSHIVRRKRDLHRENMLISKRTLYSRLC